ncbi:MAG: SRPBCC family protein [Bacteroidaceae bacterium]|nr:SRPBCC family protein [Bacteroidaceae bacterium]
MEKFESNIKEIPYNQTLVYAKLSDLNNLAAIQDKLPNDKIKNLTFDADTLSFEVSPVGVISMKIVERESPTCIKLETIQSPQAFNLWIQLLPVTASVCKMKLTIKISLNPFMKGMIKKPLAEGLEKMATMLASIPY